MKAIVFGSNGYLGRNFTYFLKNKGVETSCYDVQENPVIDVPYYNKIDITDYEKMSQINLVADYIYFFSGLTGTWQGFEDYQKYINVNEKGLLNLLTSLINQKSKAKIIFPSTRLVYKGQKDILLKEEDDKEPKTIYALNKLSCERLLEIYRKTFDVNYTVYRICVPYGQLFPGTQSYGTIDFFLKKAESGQNIILYGDGNLKRTFTHVKDICIKIFDSVKDEITDGNIYNIGGEHMSLFEVASLIAKKYNVQVEFLPWPEKALKIESGDTMFDDVKLNQVILTATMHSIKGWIKFRIESGQK